MRQLLLLLALVLSFPTYGRADDQALLGSLKSANFNTTADQSIPMRSTSYVLRRIVVTNCSASLTLAAGGFYTAAGKTGTTVVAAVQIYSALTAATKVLDVTLAAGAVGSILSSTTLFFALTTGQGSAATCDIYLYGDAFS